MILFISYLKIWSNKMPYFLFKTLVIATTSIVLMACMPKESTKDEHGQNNSHVQHRDSTHDSTTNHVSEYAQSMGKMHHAMMIASEEKDPDIAFAKGMIPHHQGAIDMANIQLKYGKDPEIRQLAEQVLKAQQPEIDMMNQWLVTYKPQQLNENLSHVKAYQESMGSHDVMMNGTQENDPDIAFVKGMIPHHQGAIDMAKIQLKYGKTEQMRKLAEDIIKAQQVEIDFMKQWLEKKK